MYSAHFFCTSFTELLFTSDLA